MVVIRLVLLVLLVVKDLMLMVGVESVNFID